MVDGQIGPSGCGRPCLATDLPSTSYCTFSADQLGRLSRLPRHRWWFTQSAIDRPERPLRAAAPEETLQAHQLSRGECYCSESIQFIVLVQSLTSSSPHPLVRSNHPSPIPRFVRTVSPGTVDAAVPLMLAHRQGAEKTDESANSTGAIRLEKGMSRVHKPEAGSYATLNDGRPRPSLGSPTQARESI